MLKETREENERLQKDLDMLVNMFERVREEKADLQKGNQ